MPSDGSELMSTNPEITYSVVIPVYTNEGSLGAVITRLEGDRKSVV